MDMGKRRQELGLTQQELADLTGVKRSTIAMIESGRNVPRIGTAKKLAQGLCIPWQDIYAD